MRRGMGMAKEGGGAEKKGGKTKKRRGEKRRLVRWRALCSHSLL
jgi:hypothetical protein